jgi:hypothetical protein
LHIFITRQTVISDLNNAYITRQAIISDLNNAYITRQAIISDLNNTYITRQAIISDLNNTYITRESTISFVGKPSLEKSDRFEFELCVFVITYTKLNSLWCTGVKPRIKFHQNPFSYFRR